MGSKKKRGSKAVTDSIAGAAQPSMPDMSKYANAYSNKSKVNYAELKLVRSDKPKEEKKQDGAENNNNRERKGRKQDKAAGESRAKRDKIKKQAESRSDKTSKKKEKAESKKNNTSSAEKSGLTAEERYSNALGKEDHYSSAVEKYYLKYPDAKRPDRTVPSRRASDPPRKKKKRSSDSGAAGQSKRSMAEIAVKNKGTSSVKEHARAARNAKARGVVSPAVGNRSFYRRGKKRSGALDVLMVTLLLVFLSAVGVAVFLNVRQVKVTGDNPYSEAQIRNICNIKKGGNILFINTQELEKKVEQTLPYIADCSIIRRLPSTVVIKVSQAEVLGVTETVMGKWSVISTDGKILETEKSLGAVNTENASYPSSFGSANELAESRKLPVLTGLSVRTNVKDGFITDVAVLKHIQNFVYIKDAFKKVKMKLTAITYGNRGYEAEYDGRIVIIFGRDIDEKTVIHRMEEVHALIFDNGYIAESDKGEIKFNNSHVYFRPSYEVSEEELEVILEQRREKNRSRLCEMAEIFMTTGDDWINGRIKTE